MAGVSCAVCVVLSNHSVYEGMTVKGLIVSLLIVLAGYVPLASAGTKAHQDPGTLFYVLGAIVLSVVIYAGNKWRLWGLGFKFGMASKSTFLSSNKWTFASVIVTGVSLLILTKTGSI